MEDKKYLKIVNSNGEEKEYEIITAFNLPETNKNYVVYTDNEKDENGKLKIYASIYYPNDESKLDPVETDEEWNAIEEVINSIEQGDE